MDETKKRPTESECQCDDTITIRITMDSAEETKEMKEKIANCIKKALERQSGEVDSSADRPAHSTKTDDENRVKSLKHYKEGQKNARNDILMFITEEKNKMLSLYDDNDSESDLDVAYAEAEVDAWDDVFNAIIEKFGDLFDEYKPMYLE